MSFVLIGVTRGDELIPPEKKVIAVSDNREKLEFLRVNRFHEREDYLSKNSVPDWQQNAIYSREFIEEVPTI